MNTLQETVKRLLEETGVPVSYHYPAAWDPFPCIAWHEAASREYAQAGAREYLTELTYAVDIWAETPEELAQIGQDVDARLAGVRFRRVFSQDLFEARTQLHHRTMRYRALSDAEGNIYQ